MNLQSISGASEVLRSAGLPKEAREGNRMPEWLHGPKAFSSKPTVAMPCETSTIEGVQKLDPDLGDADCRRGSQNVSH